MTATLIPERLKALRDVTPGTSALDLLEAMAAMEPRDA